MPLLLALQNIPNQSFTTRLDNNLYFIRLVFTNGVMSADLTRNNVVIQTGCRVVSGTPFLPYDYQSDGNFFIITENYDYPDYTQFGITQFLTYFSQAEIEAAGG